MTNTTNNDSGLNLDHLEALAPCPFCGGAARIESNRDWHKLVADHDDDCILADGEPVSVCPAQDGYRVRLTEEWNRRAAPVSAPIAIKKWQERLPLPGYENWSTGQAIQAMEAEITDLRVALANQPAPTDEDIADHYLGIEQALEMNENMRKYGTIDKPAPTAAPEKGNG